MIHLITCNKCCVRTSSDRSTTAGSHLGSSCNDAVTETANLLDVALILSFGADIQELYTQGSAVSDTGYIDERSNAYLTRISLNITGGAKNRLVAMYCDWSNAFAKVDSLASVSIFCPNAISQIQSGSNTKAQPGTHETI